MTRSVINASNINGTIGSSQIADDAVTAAKIADGTLTYSSLTGQPVLYYKYMSNLQTGINISNSTPTYINDISSFITANTIGVEIDVWFQYNASANYHGYLHGYFQQQNQTRGGRGQTYFDRDHYDWYYNVYHADYMVPWDPTGSNTLETVITSSYNSAAANTYRIRFAGRIDKA